MQRLCTLVDGASPVYLKNFLCGVCGFVVQWLLATHSGTQAKSCSAELEVLRATLADPSGDAGPGAAEGGGGGDGGQTTAGVGRRREVARRVEACARLHFAFALHALGSESYEGRVCC